MIFLSLFENRHLQRPGIRHLVKLGLDLALAALAWQFARHIAAMGSFPGRAVGLLWLLLAGSVSYLCRLPRQHYRIIGFRDFVGTVRAGLILLAASAWILLLASRDRHAVSLWLTSATFTCAFWTGLRGAVRAFHEVHPRSEPIQLKRTLIIGAGRAGVMVAEELERHPELGLKVLGFADDDLSKQGVMVHGVPVLGMREKVPYLLRKLRIQHVILAIPSATGEEIRRVADLVRATGVPIKTVPGIFNLLGHQVWRPVLRDVSIEDLLRRNPVQIDQESLASIIQGRTILITGGGGSIGGELAHQLCAFSPARLILLGRGEHSLWSTARQLKHEFPDQTIEIELCDVRSRNRVNQALASWKPFIVLHAAAHKHVPILEQCPEEGVENNIIGTRNVVEGCLANGVVHFVNISTDKAVNPTNILGATKRVAELIVADYARQAPEGTQYISVRFGNVLGSRGSVVPIFQEQIRRGGPITLTSPTMTRYFMTIPEASQLVLQAGLMGRSGSVYVLNMGEPVKIMDLASDLIRLSGLTPGKDIAIEFTGIRPGEKMHEELFYESQPWQSEVHPNVLEAQIPPPGKVILAEVVAQLYEAIYLPEESDRIRVILELLLKLVPTYTPAHATLGRQGRIPELALP